MAGSGGDGCGVWEFEFERKFCVDDCAGGGEPVIIVGYNVAYRVTGYCPLVGHYQKQEKTTILNNHGPERDKNL